MQRHRSTGYVYTPASAGDPLPDLDDVPKKSVRVQVEEMIAAGQRLKDARLSALNSVDMAEDEVVDGLNEFASADEMFAAQSQAEVLLERVARYKADHPDVANASDAVDASVDKSASSE